MQKPNGQGEQKMSLLAIDKRNGRTAYKEQFTNNMGLLDISGDAQTKTVDLVMQRDTVRLTFTDKPLPPPSASRWSTRATDRAAAASRPFGTRSKRPSATCWTGWGKGGVVGLGVAWVASTAVPIDARIQDCNVDWRRRDQLANNMIRTAALRIAVVAAALAAWSDAAPAAVPKTDVDRVVARGLEWLAAHQSRLGHWTAANDRYPTSMTALAANGAVVRGLDHHAGQVCRGRSTRRWSISSIAAAPTA